MALTVIFALAGSMVLSLTLMPVLASLGLPRKMSREGDARRPHGPPALPAAPRARACDSPGRRSSSSAPITVATTVLGFGLGSEFVPRLSEGSIVINTIRLASVSLEESLRYGTQIEGYLKKQFPDEIEDIWTRTGTAEVATDPMGLELSDIFVTLKPRERWKKAKTQEELVAAMARVTEDAARHAGRLQPADRDADQRDGRRHPGRPRHQALRRRPGALEGQGAPRSSRSSRASPGPPTSTTEQVTGLPVLRIEVDSEALSRHGVPAQAGRSTPSRPSAASTSARSSSPGGGSRSSSACRCRYRDDPDALEKILIPTAAGQRLPLTRLATARRDDRPLDHPARVGPAADHRPDERPGPRHRLVRRGGPGANRPRGEAPDRLHHRVGRPVREHEPGREAALHRRAAGPGPDPEPALPDVPLGPRRPDDLQRRALRPGRRRARALVMGLPFTISAGVGFVALAGASMLEGLVLVSCHPRPHGPRHAEARGHRAGAARAAPARAHDRARSPPSGSCR